MMNALINCNLLLLFMFCFNFNSRIKLQFFSQLYDWLKIHREQYHNVYSSDTYWIIWNTLLDDLEFNFVSICICNKMQIKLFNEMHINAMMNKDIGVIIMYFQSVIMMMISDAFFYFAVTQFLNPFCAKLYSTARSAENRFDSFQFSTNLIDVIFCGLLNCSIVEIPIVDNWKITMINYLRFICIWNKFNIFEISNSIVKTIWNGN